MKSIKVVIDEQGGIEVEANGFKGKSCERATEELIKSLGIEGVKKKKPEYFQEDKTHLHN